MRRATSVAGLVLLSVASALVGALVALAATEGALFGGARTVNWQQLSTVGEAFGTVSAVLSALALVVVAVALRVQIQQTSIARDTAMRSMRAQLLQFALDRPALLRSWGFDGDAEHAQHRAYTSLVFSYLHMAFSHGLLTEFELRGFCRRAFLGVDIAQWWSDAREVYVHGNLPESRRFVAIVDEGAAVAAGIAAADTSTRSGGRSGARTPPPAALQAARTREFPHWGTAAIAVTSAVGAAILARRARTRRDGAHRP